MIAEIRCRRCNAANRLTARFCARCGAAISSSDVVAIPAQPPPSLSPPPGFTRCDGAPELFFKWQQGEDLALGAEEVTLTLFNGGQDLRDLCLKIQGVTIDDQSFAIEKMTKDLQRGAILATQLHSFELPGQLARLSVSIESAVFAEKNAGSG